MRRVGRDHVSLFFDARAEPIAEVAAGERFVVETADSLCGLVKQEAPKGFAIEDVLARLGGACPVTGPIYVAGAVPGGVLEVHIDAVRPVPAVGQAWTGVFTGFGALSSDAFSIQAPLEPGTTLVSYDEEAASLDIGGRTARIPLRPFLGTVGVAPASERRLSFSQSPEYLGDVDLPDLTGGATLVLPVHADGALLALGDAHAAQGDGEITGAAIEIEAEAELRCVPRDAEEAGFTGLPQLNTGRFDWLYRRAAGQRPDGLRQGGVPGSGAAADQALWPAAAGGLHAARPGRQAPGGEHDRPVLLGPRVHRPGVHRLAGLQLVASAGWTSRS